MFKHREYVREPTLAEHLVSLLPIEDSDDIFNPAPCEYDCPPLSYAWAIANPPEVWLRRFLDRATTEASKGVAFIGTPTPWHLELLKERGFHLRRTHKFYADGKPHTFHVFQKVPGGVVHSWDIQPW